MARLDPQRLAIIAAEGRLTFGELDAQSDTYARGLEAIGIGRGVRTVLMVPPSLDFFPLVFGLFKAGAVVVLIDPGIGRRALLSCLDEVEPEAFIGVPAAHVARILFPRPFRKVRAKVTVGRRLFWGGHTLKQLRQLGTSAAPHPMAIPVPGEMAAILFTSGSTGIPKGAVYTHEIFDAQVRMIRDTYGIQPGEIDLPTFPLFALFDPAHDSRYERGQKMNVHGRGYPMNEPRQPVVRVAWQDAMRFCEWLSTKTGLPFCRNIP